MRLRAAPPKGKISTNMESNSDPDDHFAPPSTPSNTDYRHARSLALIAEANRQNSSHRPQSAKDEGRSRNPQYKDPRLIVVVGVCSAGKSTLVKSLKEKGYRVRIC